MSALCEKNTTVVILTLVFLIKMTRKHTSTQGVYQPQFRVPTRLPRKIAVKLKIIKIRTRSPFFSLPRVPLPNIMVPVSLGMVRGVGQDHG